MELIRVVREENVAAGICAVRNNNKNNYETD